MTLHSLLRRALPAALGFGLAAAPGAAGAEDWSSAAAPCPWLMGSKVGDRTEIFGAPALTSSGCRDLCFDREDDGRDNSADLWLHGPVLGLTFAFRPAAAGTQGRKP